MAFLEPFLAAKLKLERAEIHIGDFESEVAAFLASRPFEIVVEQSPEAAASGHHAWVTRIRKHPPATLGAILGDVVHNLRSALDVLATDLVRLNGKDAKSVYFPFAISAAEFDGQIRRKNMNRAAPDVIALLRKMRPFTGGNIALRALHDFDIQDKHQALIPTIGAVRLPSLILHMGGHPNHLPEWQTSFARDGQPVLIIPAPGNIQVGQVIPSHFGLVFPPMTPLSGDEVVPGLHRLRDQVASTIEAFKVLCASRPNLGPVHVPDPVQSGLGLRTLMIGGMEPPVDWDGKPIRVA